MVRWSPSVLPPMWSDAVISHTRILTPGDYVVLLNRNKYKPSSVITYVYVTYVCF